VTAAAYLGLVGAAVALALIPGPDTMLALRYALRGRGQGFLSALGSTTSMLAWGVLAALGVVAVLRASTLAYDILTVVGGGYIVYLGVRLIVGAVRLLRHRLDGDAPVAEASKAEADAHGRRWLDFGGPYVAGALSSITNPKVGIFFLALFPEFVPAGAEWWFVAFVLGGTCAAVGLVYFAVVILVADAANRWLRRSTVTAAVEAVSGVILTTLGLLVLVPGFIALVTGQAA
jgi:threonine/homoserine/homoserine lactone efflux protein